MNKANPSHIIAAAIQRERQRAGKSLSALAAKAGLAKSTLSQLENGAGNPSVETLWAIAAALDVPVSFLFEPPGPQARLVRAGQGKLVGSDAAGFAATLLDACPPGRRRDLYRADLQPGSRRQAAPHPAGAAEHVIVVGGLWQTGPLDGQEVLNPGDYFSFPADVPHSYEALAPDTVAIIVMETS
mgnify:CR=1 FL=1